MIKLDEIRCAIPIGNYRITSTMKQARMLIEKLKDLTITECNKYSNVFLTKKVREFVNKVNVLALS